METEQTYQREYNNNECQWREIYKALYKDNNIIDLMLKTLDKCNNN